MIMGLRDIGESLPPGFRFYPSDEELVCHYLYKKISNEQALKGTLVDVDLHICEPWQLPDVAKLNATEWYFFSFRDRKYATGFRTNRATITGYWKATGKDRTVHDPITREIVGMRKTLVFYKNRAPNGIKTGWIMHEFRLESPHMPPKEDWVLCRVFHKGKSSEEKSDNLSPQMPYDTTSIAHEHNTNLKHFTYDHNHHHQLSNSSPPSIHQNQNPSSLLNLLHFSHGTLTDTDMMITSKLQLVDEDSDYGFLYDMNLEENSLEDIAYDDNMVFI